MGIPFIIGASQQKKKRVLDFYPFVAPADFDRTAQPVDIYDVFERYYRTNANAKFIYSFTSAIATLTLPAVSGYSYRWGETISGVPYVYDVSSGTAFTAGSTNRYVIVKNIASTFVVNQSNLPVGAVWIYLGHFTMTTFSVNNWYTSVNTYAKYIHCHDLADIQSLSVEYGFYNCTNLTGNLTIPDNVTSIGKQAFQNCTGLIGTLKLPSSMTTLGGYGVFKGCTGFTDLDLGSTIQYIQNTNGGNIWGSFADCTNITKTSFTLPNSLLQIGNGTFYNCSKIGGSLTLSSNVTVIGVDAFRGTKISGNLTIPSSVVTLGGFYGCNLLTGTITVPNSTTTISTGAFRNCTGLTGLSIGTGVTDIQQEAFYQCSNITGTLTLPDSLITVGIQAFQYSGFTGALTIPNNVVTINYGAFGYMTGLTSLTLGTSLATLGSYVVHVGVFYGSTNIAGTLTLPDSLVTIGVGCFAYLTKLTGNLTIPDNVTTIKSEAFRGCTGFNGTLTIGSSVATVENYAFTRTKFTAIAVDSSNTNFVSDDEVLYDESTEVRAVVSAGGYSGTLTLRGTTTKIDYECFYNNSLRTGSLSFPETLTNIMSYAFYGCSGFTGTLTIPNTIPTALYNHIFAGCYGFTSLVLPNNVVSAGTSAFDGWTGFTGTLTFPSTFTTMGLASFRSMNPSRIDSYPNIQPADGGNNFSYNAARTLHVPSGSSSYTTGIWANSNYFVQPITKDL